MRNQFRSRRGYDHECKWWSVDENAEFVESNELILARQPICSFWAKEISAESKQPQIIAGAFMMEQTFITLKSPDNLYGMKKNDAVLYDGYMWRVRSVQRKQDRQQQAKNVAARYESAYWFLELKR